jgi:hypothetical protein
MSYTRLAVHWPREARLETMTSCRDSARLVEMLHESELGEWLVVSLRLWQLMAEMIMCFEIWWQAASIPPSSSQELLIIRSSISSIDGHSKIVLSNILRSKCRFCILWLVNSIWHLSYLFKNETSILKRHLKTWNWNIDVTCSAIRLVINMIDGCVENTAKVEREKWQMTTGWWRQYRLVSSEVLITGWIQQKPKVFLSFSHKQVARKCDLQIYTFRPF